MRRLTRAGGAAVVIALVIAFAATFGVLTRAPFVAGLFPGLGWHTYRDPAGLFSVSVPPGWTGRYTDEGAATEGGPTGSATTENYDVTLGNPPDGAASFKLVIYYWTLPNDFARQWQCQQRQNLNTTIDGLPAEHPGGTLDDPWFLDTHATHYQINYVPAAGYSGGPGGPRFPANWTPPPTSAVSTTSADEQTFMRILASFTPTPATPIAC